MSNPVVFILNGPNLNLLGEREPEIYGRTTLAEVEERSRRRSEARGLTADFRQTNFEGVLIESVHGRARRPPASSSTPRASPSPPSPSSTP